MPSPQIVCPNMPCEPRGTGPRPDGRNRSIAARVPALSAVRECFLWTPHRVSAHNFPMPSAPSASPVRVGLIGYGLAGSVFHAPFIESSPALELAAIVTSDSERRAKAVHEHP